MDEEEIDFTKLKYVLYARKSTEEAARQVKSIEDQIDECKALALRLHLRVVDVLKESKSAKHPNNRPVFNQMLRDIKAGKYDGILSWHPDRLARNMLEAGQLIDMIDEKVVKDLKFVTHHFTSDANGKMLLGMAFVLSKEYSDKLSQDVTRGVRGRLTKEGKTPAPKHGYSNENGLYYPDGDNHKLICAAWQMRKDGVSVEDIAQYLNKNGYFRIVKSNGRKIKMTKQILSRIFTDSFYYGTLVQAKQKVDLIEFYGFIPAVSEEDYWLVQQLSYRRMKPSKPHKIAFYPLRKMVLCSFCQKTMVVAPSTSSGGGKLLYYRCDNDECIRNDKSKETRPKASIRAKIVFNFIYEFLNGGLNFSQAEYQKYYDNLTQLSDQRLQQLRGGLHNREGMLKHTLREIKERSLQIIKFDPNSTIYKENEKKVAELEQEQQDLEAEIAKLREKLAKSDGDRLTVDQFLNLSKNAAKIVKSANEIAKDEICRIIFLNLTVDDEKVLSCQLKEPFATLMKNRKILNGRGERT